MQFVAVLRFTCIASRGGLYGVWSKRAARQVQQAGPYFSRLSTTPLNISLNLLMASLGCFGANRCRESPKRHCSVCFHAVPSPCFVSESRAQMARSSAQRALSTPWPGLGPQGIGSRYSSGGGGHPEPSRVQPRFAYLSSGNEIARAGGQPYLFRAQVRREEIADECFDARERYIRLVALAYRAREKRAGETNWYTTIQTSRRAINEATPGSTTTAHCLSSSEHRRC